jgi:serine/threonine-protein kinase
MSPEQARGAAVDKRADIWAFGCVLYEMLTGKQAFHGETASDILAMVLKEEPDWSALSADTPLRIRKLLRRCLERDRNQRLRDIGEARIAIDAPDEERQQQRSPSGLWPWAAAALAVVLSVTAVGWWRATHSSTLRPLVQLSAELSPDTTSDRFRGGEQLAISPDGARLAVAVRDLADPKYRLVTRRLEESEFTPLSGTEGANMPFFSPDGQWIAFFADGKLKKVPVQGGSPATLCDAPRPRGGSWGDDYNIIAALNAGGGLMRVPSGGGAPTVVTKPQKEIGETALFWPQVLPGSQAVLFTPASGGGHDEDNVEIFSFKTGERKTVLRGGFFGRYLATSNGTGHLVYIRQNILYAAPFDLSRLAVTGVSQPVLEDISVIRTSGTGNFAFSQTGTFIYLSWKRQFPWSIFWMDSAGRTEPLHRRPGILYSPRFSPDGKHLAFSMQTGPMRQGQDIWVKDLERDATSRLTSLPDLNEFPVWTPDGHTILFSAFGSVAPGIYWIRADGVGEPQPLTTGKAKQMPSSFSPDGKWLVYHQFGAAAGNLDIWKAPVYGDPDHPKLGKAEQFLRGPFSAYSARFSPDGRWLAYTSDETGTVEVHVRPFPGPGGRWQVSTGGGRYPTWSANGRELFFLASDRRIMVAKYTAKRDSFTSSKPQMWSEKRLVDAPFSTWDLAPDGKRLAVVLYADGTTEEEKPFTHVTVLQNFFDELKRRVPAGAK